jgi:hypothetical protein
MTQEKKQPVDVEILEKIIKIKGLEKELANSTIIPNVDVDSLRTRGFSAEEINGFLENYKMVSERYLSHIIPNLISRNLQGLYNQYKDVLMGTPEERYLVELIGNKMGEPDLNIKVEDLQLSIRTSRVLKDEGIIYMGQLVQKTDGELLRAPSFGRKSLNEVKEVLKHHGLQLGMDVNYFPIKEKEK